MWVIRARRERARTLRSHLAVEIQSAAHMNTAINTKLIKNKTAAGRSQQKTANGAPAPEKICSHCGVESARKRRPDAFPVPFFFSLFFVVGRSDAHRDDDFINDTGVIRTSDTFIYLHCGEPRKLVGRRRRRQPRLYFSLDP